MGSLDSWTGKERSFCRHGSAGDAVRNGDARDVDALRSGGKPHSKARAQRRSALRNGEDVRDRARGRRPSNGFRHRPQLLERDSPPSGIHDLKCHR